MKLFNKSGKFCQTFVKVLPVGVQVLPSNNGRSNMVWSLSPDIFRLQQGFLSNKEVVVGGILGIDSKQGDSKRQFCIMSL